MRAYWPKGSTAMLWAQSDSHKKKKEGKILNWIKTIETPMKRNI